MSNPLVAEAEETGGFEGAGIVSSYVDVGSAAAEGNWPNAAFAAGGAALDTLGFVADPIGALASAGVGWVIEHVGFLREPLDALAGDPNQIRAYAATWHNVAGELRAVAGDHRTQLPDTTTWAGAASEAYRASAQAFGARLDTAAGQADELAEVVMATGAGVGTVRALIRDWIADFVVDVVIVAGVALAAAAVTAGGSMAAAITAIVARALHLATDIASRIGLLLQELAANGTRVGELVEIMRSVAGQARGAGPSAVEMPAGTDGFVEAGKETTKES